MQSSMHQGTSNATARTSIATATDGIGIPNEKHLAQAKTTLPPHFACVWQIRRPALRQVAYIWHPIPENPSIAVGIPPSLPGKSLLGCHT